MAVREFDGSDDQITVDNGAITDFTNSAAFSIMLLLKPTTLAGGEGFMSVNSGSEILASPYDNSGGQIGLGSDTSDVFASVGLTASAWQVLVITKPSGAAQTPRGHRKVLGSGSWTHQNFGAAFTHDDASVATDVVFGRIKGFGLKDMRLAVAAVFQDANLSDGTVESIESTPTTAFLNTLAPTALWDFNQANVADDVLDLTGGGANETAITGTTVVGGDDPAWTFGVETVVVGGGGGFARPGRHRGRAPSREGAWW